MGRKSRKKKEAKKVEKLASPAKGGQQKSQHKSQNKAQKKTQKKQQKPQKQPKVKKHALKIKEKLHTHKSKIFGGIFATIMLLILVWVGFMIFERALRPTPIAKLLPADSTVMTVEINTDPEHNQHLRSIALLEAHPEYNRDAFVQYLEQKFLVNFDQDLAPWVGRSVGVAYLRLEDEEDLSAVYFAEIANSTEAAKMFEGKEKIEHNFTDIYISGKGIYMLKIDNYMFASLQQSALEHIIDHEDDNKLFYDDDYRRIDNNLPISKAGFLYINFDKIDDAFFKTFKFLGEKGITMEKVAPFIKLFESEGFALIALDTNFVIESFLSLEVGELDSSKYISHNQKYRANLTEYYGNDVIAFWGGENLEYQIKKKLEVMSGGDKAAVLIFDSLLDNYVQRYFGPEVELTEDILPLFEREFALGIEDIEGNDIYKLVIELDDVQDDALKIQELASKFAQIGGFFEPTVVEHTLEDGTKSKEIIAAPEQITKSESQYEDTTIYELKIGEKEWGIYYAIINDIAVISNHPSGVRTTIDITKGTGGNLRNSEAYMNNIEPVLSNSDEVAFFSLEKLIPLLAENEVPGILNIISTMSSGKNYFDDGVSTINYLHIK